MATRRLTPTDAQSFWLSAKIPNDTFLLFGFAGVPDDVERAIREMIVRADACDDLTLRIAEGRSWNYPAWVHAKVNRAQFVVHHLHDATWARCLDAVSDLIADQVDPRVAAWRLHLFVGIVGVPGSDGPGTVAVLQISHALGGGGRTSAPAAVMFGRLGRGAPPISSRPSGPVALLRNGFRASRAHRRLVADEASGAVPPQAAPRPPLRTNAPPTGPRGLRTVIRRRADLGGGTVTVAILVAVSQALAEHLAALGDDPSTLGAEVPMAKPPPRFAYNHFGNVSVGLYPDLAAEARAAAIAEDFASRRLRAGHDAMGTASAAFATVPAPLLRWGVAKFDADVRPLAVSGNTVVSSVNCGPADFALGGAPVTVAAAFAGLSPAMGLTHVVVGVGDVVTIGVHAAESAVGGPGGLDAYVARLEAALGPRS